MKVLVAGGSGLVGGSVIRNAPSEVEIFAPTRKDLDLSQPSIVKDYLLSNAIDSVIMAAAQVGGIGANSSDQYGFLYQNLQLQNGIIEGARISSIKNFLFLGSSCIYPKNELYPIKEESILTGPLEETNEGYALAKITGVKMCRAIRQKFGLNFFSLMPTNLYGPCDNFNLVTAHVPAALIRKFHEAKINSQATVEVWGTGTPLREFMHVDDLANACWYFLNRQLEFDIVNIGTGKEISISNFAHLIAEEVGYTGQIVFDGSKPNGAIKKLLDVNLAKKLGWESSISLSSGISATYKWFADAYPRGEFRD